MLAGIEFDEASPAPLEFREQRFEPLLMLIKNRDRFCWPGHGFLLKNKKAAHFRAALRGCLNQKLRLSRRSPVPPTATHTHAQGEKNARLRAEKSLCGLFAGRHGSPCSIRDSAPEKVA